MQHLVLFLYFLFLSSGFAGITVMAILVRRIGHAFLGWMLAVLTTFTLWLLITLIIYYIESIISYPFPSRNILGLVNLVLGTLTYVFMFLARLASPAPVRPLTLAAALAPIGIYYLMIILGSTVFPGLLEPAADYPQYYGMFSIFAGSVFVSYIGAGYYKGASGTRQETLKFLLRWFGLAMLFFALVIFVLGVYLTLQAAEFQPAILLEFVFFFVYNIIAIAAFVRYLILPSAFLEEGKVSESFISEYGISAREAEVIELISQGMSNKEIADHMHVSFTTVRTHVYNIFKKAEVGSRVELLRIVSGYRQ
jgi:DNA-binding CsgD family transcriptional regulator